MTPRRWVLVAVSAIVLILLRDAARDAVLLTDRVSPPRAIELSHAAQLIRDGAISAAVVKGDSVKLTGRSGASLTTRKEPDTSFLATLQSLGVTTEQLGQLRIEVQTEPDLAALATVIALSLVILAAIVFILFRPRMGWSPSGSGLLAFRKSAARENSSGGTGITFADVAGAQEAKEELREVVEFLQSPQRFVAIGARVPRGVLLTGLPGTGKTLLARATAGEAGVPFFSCSGSEFVEMFVGVGASRVRDLFGRAKKSAPCIIFIDEIDALGRKRNGHAGNEERDQTLNQILVEMDGFDQSCNVVVMAATNRPDVLDSALLRPGRFDRRIVVDSPSAGDRLAILLVHAQRKPLSAEVDLERIARQTAGFSGADLENVMNEAALLAARGRRGRIQPVDLEEAVDRVLVGLARRSKVIGEREKWVTAYHECGHALVAHELAGVDPVQRVSIIPRGGTGGHTRLLPMEDRHLWSRSQLTDGIAFALGGMAAEELVFGEMTTGSAGDLAEAGKIARNMVCCFGMSKEFGPMVLAQQEEGHWPPQVSEDAASRAESEIRRLLEDGRRKAAQILEAERPRLKVMAERLFEVETLQGEELASLLKGAPVPGTTPDAVTVAEPGGPFRVAASS